MTVNLRSRYWLWLLQTFLRRHYTLVLLGVIGGVLLSLTLIFFPRLKLEKPARQTVGIVGQFATDSLPAEVLSGVGQGLTSIGPDGQPLPGLASSWTVSSDLLTYTFHLLPGLAWSDGTLVKAQELDYHFKDATMRAVSNSTVEIQLKEPYSPLPVIVSRPLFKKNFVGTGPYRISSIKKSGSRVVEVALSAIEGTGKPDLTYHFYPSETALATAWKLGEVKGVRDLTSTSAFDGWSVKFTKEVKKDRFVGVFFNSQDPVVKEKAVRQALAYAIKDKTPEGTNRALGPISPDSWAYTANLKKYDFDLGHAKKLLEKVATNSADMRLILTTFPTLLPLAEKIKEDWGKLGLKVETRVVSSIPDSFQALLITQAVPADPDQYNLWHSTQSSNITRLNKPKIDKLLEVGRKTEGMVARKPIYAEFQQNIVEELPVIFLYHPFYYTLTRP